MEELLEKEEQTRQKLDLDKVNLDMKLKMMEERSAEIQDAHDKLLKEKKNLEERINLLTKQLFEEEEKAKQFAKRTQRVYRIFLTNKYYNFIFSGRWYCC